ncbi:MipA/OmpV family protein [Palleronia sp. LCG004]|uniref:MipA/OmpV family protein n=1 Tax=Palleronia sp. LCG004 TaxID=3079304 RepID=UPI002943B39C|nr:MipA/OmpV family protein [Palleronia sp. LCG004]WOI55667.1 MipA/OmpV family protein [Palleronia sp. LCG004]
MSRIAIAAILSTLPGLALAGDLTMPVAESAPAYAAPRASTPDLVFTLRGGVASTPDYFGSDSYGVGPDFGFRLGYANLFGRELGNADASDPGYGLGLRGSFRYIDERSGDDNSELAGLDDVDETLELGLGLGYTSYRFNVFADARYGVVGHESFVGELGADVITYPTDNLTVTLGPRMLIGSGDYADTYFGVTESEAARSNFAAYDPDGGVLSAGLELGATYAINDRWGVEGAVTWDRFMGDAEDSPIVQQGDRDQYGLRVGITRQITLDF